MCDAPPPQMDRMLQLGNAVAVSKRRPRRTINWRGTPEPAVPQIVHVPGLAQQMLAELAPLLAEDGYHLDADGVLDGPDTSDPEALQAALDRAVARHNLAQSTPVGTARENTCTTLQLAVQAIAADDHTTATALLDTVPPVAATPDEATVAGCIGTGLSLLDTWLSGHHLDTPTDLGASTRLPAGPWDSKHAATDIITNARQHRAFDTQNAIILRHGGRAVHHGTALALTATLQTWATLTDHRIDDLAHLHIA